MKKEEKNLIDYAKRFWNFIWHDDSWGSWIVFIIVIFILIRFVFFPGLALITGSSLPLAIVESCSMYHEDGFDEWWDSHNGWYEDNGISKEDFESFPLRNGFNKGDVFLILGTSKEKLEIGDTIIFQSSSGKPIIHRVVDLNLLATKGDNNKKQFNLDQSEEINPGRIDETDISEEQIIGRATVVRIPLIGWAKLIFYEPLRESGKGFCEQQ
jgi:signal peptidase I